VSEEPLYPTAIIGYRLWLLREGSLYSRGFGRLEWKTGLNHAVCRREAGHQAPDASCECGLYAYHEPDVMRSEKTTPFVVGGAVLARGLVQIHAHGIRAEQMQIIALYLPRFASSRTRRQVARAAARYDVPVARSLRQLRRLAQRYGAPAPEQLRPALSARRPRSAARLLRLWVRNNSPMLLIVGAAGLLAGFTLNAITGNVAHSMAAVAVGCLVETLASLLHRCAGATRLTEIAAGAFTLACVAGGVLVSALL